MKRALAPALVLAAAALAAAEFVGVRADLLAQRTAIGAEFELLSAAFGRHAAAAARVAEAVRNSEGAVAAPAAQIAAAQMELAAARTPESKIASYAALRRALARLYLAAQEDPKVAQSAGYRQANEEALNAESALAEERRKYNDLLEHYNAALRRFPYNAVASLCGLTRIDAYVKTEEMPY